MDQSDTNFFKAVEAIRAKAGKKILVKELIYTKTTEIILSNLKQPCDLIIF